MTASSYGLGRAARHVALLAESPGSCFISVHVLQAQVSQRTLFIRKQKRAESKHEDQEMRSQIDVSHTTPKTGNVSLTSDAGFNVCDGGYL